MIELRPWTPCAPPSEEAPVQSVWHLAAIASGQHPLNVRALYDGSDLLAFGGVCALRTEDGYAFLWQRPGLSPFVWRRIMAPLRIGIGGAHERGMRRISAIVAAASALAIRLIRALGFAFAGVETGFAGTTEPMLRYVHCWPAFPQPILVAHQLRELELACFAAWAPELAA